MNKTRLQPDILATEAGNRHRQICLIVSYLMQVLHIPDGDHVVQVFGSGYESTNREALVHWVENIGMKSTLMTQNTGSDN